MTAAPAALAPAARVRLATPCVASEDGAHCVAGLLYGVACCADGECALCVATAQRMVRSGFSIEHAALATARSRQGLLTACPACGFPPPPVTEPTPLPRLDRSDRVLAPGTHCAQCGRRLLSSRRRYCSNECWNAFVTWSRRERRLARV